MIYSKDDLLAFLNEFKKLRDSWKLSHQSEACIMQLDLTISRLQRQIQHFPTGV